MVCSKRIGKGAHALYLLQRTGSRRPRTLSPAVAWRISELRAASRPNLSDVQRGNKVEQEFARQSPEAVLRSTKWVKRGGKQKSGRTSPFKPQNIGGKHLFFYSRDPESGYVLLWQPDTLPGSIKPLSQFVILNEDGEQIGLVPIPTEIKTGRELAKKLRLRQ